MKSIPEKNENISPTAKKKKTKRRNLHIGIWNEKSLSIEDKLLEMEEQLKSTRWDIIGVNKVRENGECHLELKSDNLMFYKGEENYNIDRTGILSIKSENNFSTVSTSPRIIYVTPKLSNRYKLKNSNVFAPTSTRDDEVVDHILIIEKLSSAEKSILLDKRRCIYRKIREITRRR